MAKESECKMSARDSKFRNQVQKLHLRIRYFTDAPCSFSLTVTRTHERASPLPLAFVADDSRRTIEVEDTPSRLFPLTRHSLDHGSPLSKMND
ncbi:hypothetical protein ACLOJK_038355 [Asimina triloba]